MLLGGGNEGLRGGNIRRRWDVAMMVAAVSQSSRAETSAIAGSAILVAVIAPLRCNPADSRSNSSNPGYPVAVDGGTLPKVRTGRFRPEGSSALR